jgi:hypothetical protein
MYNPNGHRCTCIWVLLPVFYSPQHLYLIKVKPLEHYSSIFIIVDRYINSWQIVHDFVRQKEIGWYQETFLWWSKTSCLEGFHSTLNHWHPKMQHFSWLGTYCRYSYTNRIDIYSTTGISSMAFMVNWNKLTVQTYSINLQEVCKFVSVDVSLDQLRYTTLPIHHAQGVSSSNCDYTHYCTYYIAFWWRTFA